MDLAVERQADLDIPAVGDSTARLRRSRLWSWFRIELRVEGRSPVAWRIAKIPSIGCSDRQNEGLDRRQPALVRDRVEPPGERVECAVDRRIDKATRSVLRPRLARPVSVDRIRSHECETVHPPT